MNSLFIVSDATGATGERVVRSALVQFAEAEVSIVRRAQIRTPEQVRDVVAEAAAAGAVVVHTLVSDELRERMLAESRLHAVDAMDLMGPLLERLARYLKLTPQEKPGLFQQLAEARSREIEAVEFAFHHDDGQKAEELDRAEIVLVGVSRAMKTPTMLYLAYRGWFAANVPIVPGIPLPDRLVRLPRERVVYLAVSPVALLELRRTRARMGLIPEEPYASPQHIARELLCCQQLCLEHGWRTVEVTGKSVEEVSREIATLLGDQQRRPPA